MKCLNMEESTWIIIILLLVSVNIFLPFFTQVISETSRAKSQVCLKDLCPEDKRRIANLIEELAR